MESTHTGRSGDIVRLPQPGCAALGFTARDRHDLASWGRASRRVEFHECDEGPFALLHVEGMPWASWGLTRRERRILVWDAVTLADIGCFSSMTAALAALPTGEPIPVASNVLLFDLARCR